MHQPHGPRLDSWKAIADYLDRNVRTATRWADERGLPIHRVPGGKRQAVFAYTHEIDAWLVSRNANSSPSNGNGFLELSESTDNNGVNTVPPEAKIPLNHRSRLLRFTLENKRPLLTVGLCLLCLAWAIDMFFLRTHSAAALRPLRFTQLTDDGRIKQNLHIHGETFFYNEYDGIRQVIGSSPIGGGRPRRIESPFSNVYLQDVSKDGQNLLITAYEGIELERKLWAIPVAGGDARRIGQIKCRWARWSPDNSKIAFTTGQNLLIANADGLNVRVMVAAVAGASQPLWSADGQRLRFLRYDPSSATLSPWEVAIPKDNFMAPLQPVALALGKTCCADWTWTADDRHLAYLASGTDRHWKLVVSSQNTSMPNWLTPPLTLPISVGEVNSLAASSTGNIFYLLIQTAQRGQLLKYSLKDGAFETLLPGLSARYLSYSRDGQWLCYLNSMDESLWRSRADGTGAIRLSPPEMKAQLCSWSPDGHQIAFMGQLQGKPWRIHLVGKDGGVPSEASAGTDNQGAPSWSPDGKSLAYANVLCQETQSCSVRTLDLSSGTVQTLPGSHGFRTARWAPDGRYIAALEPETHELMLFDRAALHWKTLAGSVKGDDINWSRDSQYVYVDNPQGEAPAIDRIRIKDGLRSTVVRLDFLQKMSGRADLWFGIAPDDSPIFLHLLTSSEVYALDWTDH
jgi:Tol biopolymer transport system component